MMYVPRKPIELEAFGYYDKLLKYNRGVVARNGDIILLYKFAFAGETVGVTDFKKDYVFYSLLTTIPVPNEKNNISNIPHVTREFMDKVRVSSYLPFAHVRVFTNSDYEIPTAYHTVEMRYKPKSKLFTELFSNGIIFSTTRSQYNIIETAMRKIVAADIFMEPREPDREVTPTEPNEWLWKKLLLSNQSHYNIVQAAVSGDLLSIAALYYNIDLKNPLTLIPSSDARPTEELVNKIHQWYLENAEKIQVAPKHGAEAFIRELETAAYEYYTLDDELAEEIISNIKQNLELLQV